MKRQRVDGSYKDLGANRRRSDREKRGRSSKPTRPTQSDKPKAPDPIAGQRERINAGSKQALVWDDDGTGCPVEVDQLFKLRSCRIRITHRRRVQRGRQWLWIADFQRIKPDRLYLLDKRGGYTQNEAEQINVHDHPDDAPTLVPFEGAQPPEPEAVDPDEVDDYEASERARERHAFEQAARRRDHAALPLELRLASLRRAAKDSHIDISSEVRVIEQRVAKLERKVLDRAA